MKTIALVSALGFSGAALLIACSSSDSGGSAGATAAAGSAGTGGGSAGAAGQSGVGGAAGSSSTCTKGPDCTGCCGQKDPASGLLLEQTAVQCACGDAGKCITQCAATMCQVPSQQPDDTCNSCTQLGCFAAITAACTSEACKQVLSCMVACSM